MERTYVDRGVFAACLPFLLGVVLVGFPSSGQAQEEEPLEARQQQTASGDVGSNIGPGAFGLGLGRGTLASGLSGKMYLTPGTALQAHLGYTNGWGWGSCRGGQGRYEYDCRSAYGFGLNVDFVGTFAELARGSAGRLFAGAGGGGALSSGGPYGNGLLAANGVVELGWHFSAVPIELVADWRPFIGAGSRGAFFSLFDFGFSARFYF